MRNIENTVRGGVSESTFSNSRPDGPQPPVATIVTTTREAAPNVHIPTITVPRSGEMTPATRVSNTAVQERERAPIRAVEAEDVTGNHIRWFGIESDDGNVVKSAAAFDIPLAFHNIATAKHYDYVDLAPFDNKLRDTDTTSSTIKVLSEERLEDSGIFKTTLMKLTGEDIISGKNSRDVMRLASIEGKRPLIISGHGGGDIDWRIGSEGDSSTVEMTQLLSNLGSVLQSVNPEVPDVLAERYNVVLLASCNEGGVFMRYQTVDALGIPLVYKTGKATITADPQDTVFQLPNGYKIPPKI